MSTILIKKVTLNNTTVDILIEGNRIQQIAPVINVPADENIDAAAFICLPSFFNGHTHAAMTLMRGYSDDQVVLEWLRTKIWPLEEQLTEEDVYWGTKLACLEMIKSGTTFFNDMYWFFHGTARAVDEMGLRSAVSAVSIDMFDMQRTRREQLQIEQLYRETMRYSDRIRFALGPHAIYTVSEENLRFIKAFADGHDCQIHFHLAESQTEVTDCLQKHNLSPVQYLEKIGFLGPNLVACHAIWLSAKDMAILKANDVKIVHLPVSAMKLSSGVIRYKALKKHRLPVILGTDGCASNNNLNMIEEMKFASLLQKSHTGDPTIFPAAEVFEMVTRQAAAVFGIDAGEIAVGKLADLVLIDKHAVSLTPNHNLLSNIVYSASPECINTVICDGRILMRDRHIPAEREIIETASRRAYDLVHRRHTN